jgi:hypothetical protein
MLTKLIDFLLRRNPEREMFLTHTPEHYRPGKVENEMVITRQERIGDTALMNGGRAPCWRILGRELTISRNSKPVGKTNDVSGDRAV